MSQITIALFELKKGIFFLQEEKTLTVKRTKIMVSKISDFKEFQILKNFRF
jgi:hypothetical protein